ncbi:MAG: protein kinase [Prevotella sp.]|nr:protein kinase [Prevotella sp.]
MPEYTPMLEGNTIKGYRILKDFIVAGGMSKISFAEKGGKEYFIKEFLSPKYPLPESPGSEKIKAQKRKECEVFEKHHQELNRKIGTKVSLGGNLVFAVDFFRWGTCYYKVTEKIDTTSLSCEEIAELPFDKIILIAKSVCHSVRILHDLNIVHGDLKPDNILIKKTSMGYSGKLIDFDDSYFSGNPPTDHESLVGTPEYYSPEQAAYIMDEEEEIAGNTLTLKSDVFTLGIILCEYFTGKKPVLPSDCGSTWICVKNGNCFSYAKNIPVGIRDLINRMLKKNPSERPTINEVFEILKGMKSSDMETIGPTFTSDSPSKPTEKVELRSTFKKEAPVSTKTETKSTLRSKTWNVS